MATVCFISLQTAKQAGQERLQVRERDCERKLGRDNEGNRKGAGGWKQEVESATDDTQKYNHTCRTRVSLVCFCYHHFTKSVLPQKAQSHIFLDPPWNKWTCKNNTFIVRKVYTSSTPAYGNANATALLRHNSERTVLQMPHDKYHFTQQRRLPTACPLLILWVVITGELMWLLYILCWPDLHQNTQQ